MSDYTPTGVPVADSAGASSEIRAEFVLIQTAIATKLDSGGALGTPASGTLTNCTGLPAAGVVGTALVAAAIGTTVQAYDADLTTWAGITPGTGIATALAADVGSAGAPVVNGGALGTPSSGVATNLTGTAAGLTAGSVTTNANLTGHVTSVGNAAVLGSFTMAQLNSAISDGDVPSARVSCYLGAHQTLADPGTWYKLNFDTEEYDNYTEYNAGTYTFTASAAGNYEIQLTARFALGVAGDWAEVAVYKNGVRVRTVRASTGDSATAIAQPTVVCSLALAATDTVEFYGYYNSGTGSRSVIGTGLSGEQTFASIKKL